MALKAGVAAEVGPDASQDVAGYTEFTQSTIISCLHLPSYPGTQW